MNKQAPDDPFKIPSEIEAEEACLGSLFIDPEAIYDIQFFLKPEQFYRVSNGWIYEAICELADERAPIDLITVESLLERKNRLDEAGGMSYLIGLVNNTPTSMHLKHYADLIVAAHTRRQLIRAAERIAKHSIDGELTPAEALAKAENELLSISLAEKMHRPTQTIKEIAAHHMEAIEDLSKNGVSTMVPSGFKDLDILLGGGFEKGSLVIIAADTSMGKSSLAREIVFNAAKNDHPGIIFTLEMPNRQVFQRQVTADSRIALSRLKTADLEESEWPIYYRTAGELSQLPIEFCDNSVTPEQFMSQCRRMKMKQGLDIGLVDLMHQMTVTEKQGTETLRLGYISRMLKMAAMDLEMVVIAVLQLNTKQIAGRLDKRPTLADVRNSSDPNGDADVVLLLYRDEYYNPDTSERPNIGELNIAKNRDMPTGVVDLYWNGILLSFRNLQRQEIML